jgi:hypothetical protein
MRRSKIYILFILIFIIALFAAYQYIFNIYEVTYSVDPPSLFADDHSTVIISVIPLNAFGWRAPFRYSSASFEIKEGKELIEIIKEDNKNGEMVLKAKRETGLVAVLIKSEHSLLPSLIEIRIYPNITQK